MKLYNSFSVAERFMRYAAIDTQSDATTGTTPSTEKQKKLAALLATELKETGIADAHMDEWGYVYATIPSNTNKKVPAICFCSHVDTSPDCSGTNVKPILHKNFNGNDIVLPDDVTQVITITEHPYLQQKIGEDIITASGTTLLGADDKAGIAIIMELAAWLQKHPDIKHGDIKILFTPDEEIGSGVNKVNMEKLQARFGYTLDGGERGSLEAENFSADGMKVIFYGISAHPGDAKNKMVNAVKVAAAFVASLPAAILSPETTDDKKGFIHPVHIEGIAEKATVQFIIRDFETAKLQQHEELIKKIATKITTQFKGAKVSFEIEEQYRNMQEIISKHPTVIEYAAEAMQRAGVKATYKSIRGGTDGCRLSFMGLPCPNIFTGEMALHGKHEYVSVQDMQKSIETLIHLVMVWEEKS
jgi:tripeptide aminopeptidase